MPKEVTKIGHINAIVDGQSAYDFRNSVNQMIGQTNNAFDTINDMYDATEINATICQNSAEQVGNAEETISNYVEQVKKPEINDYVDNYICAELSDMPTIQERRNPPVKNKEGYLPDYWYKIMLSGPFVLYAEIFSNTKKVSNLRLDKKKDWALVGNSWDITGSGNYDQSSRPTPGDRIELRLKLEGGCSIDENYAGNVQTVRPEYDINSQTIIWNCGLVENWEYCKTLEGKKLKITDGVQDQSFNIKIVLTPKQIVN